MITCSPVIESYSLLMDTLQVAAEMPPHLPEDLTLKAENLDNAGDYEILPLPPLEKDRFFAKGQYIAKACQHEDGSVKYYPARINTLSKAGPWAIFEDKVQHKHTDISVENYGTVWAFLEKKKVAGETEDDGAKQARAEASARRKQLKEEREAKAAALKAARPVRTRTGVSMRELGSDEERDEEPSEEPGDVVPLAQQMPPAVRVRSCARHDPPEAVKRAGVISQTGESCA